MPTTADTDTAPPFAAEACVIGAGPAGLAAGKALAERGISFDWYEKSSMVGGLWQINNDDSAAYRTLHLNSSRQRTQYPSYPMPDDWPDYPSHELVAEYFEDFAAHFGLLPRITFNAPVTAVEPVPGPGAPGAHGWEVTVEGQPPRRYRYVLVANGHHGTPHVPDLPGTFSGESFHSHTYQDPAVFADKDVVVLGVGNSGMDIACDAAKVARRVFLVTRHGVHVIPKYAFGVPVDHLSSPAMAYAPFLVERTLYEAVMRLSVGRPQDRGLPKPDHRLLHAHPTVSAELYDRVGHGDIIMKPAIERLDGHKINFADGSVEHADTLVYATGYEVSLPFLDPDVFDASDNRMPLYQRAVASDRPGLFFIGFMQTVGANIALMEYQSSWLGDVISGECVLPSEAQMQEWIDADRASMAKRYIRSQRHTMQVDYWRYIRSMKEERARKAHPSLWNRVTRPLAGLR